MTAHTSVHDDHHRHEQRLFRLNWPSFWLLGGILAGILALIGLVFFGLVTGL